ncbi:MAG: hypothetical protein R6U46_08045 [Marinilabilia sp.]
MKKILLILMFSGLVSCLGQSGKEDQDNKNLQEKAGEAIEETTDEIQQEIEDSDMKKEADEIQEKADKAVDETLESLDQED